MPPDPLSAAGAAKEVYDLYKVAKDEGWLERFWDLFKHKQRVLVVGSTGVGKSSFLNSLTSELTTEIDRFDRTEFTAERAIKLGDTPFRFIDTPGQDEHISRREEAYRNAVKDGIDGVINVVSFGYHEYKREVVELGTSPAIGTNHRVDQTFLTDHRKVEEDAIKEWATLILPGARWLITAVNKADLWWSDRTSVHEHYAAGTYASALGARAKMMSPIVLQYSVRFQKFYGQSPLDGTFDETDRSRLRIQFIRQLMASASTR